MIKQIPFYKVQCIYKMYYFQQEGSISIKERKTHKTQVPRWSKEYKRIINI